MRSAHKPLNKHTRQRLGWSWAALFKITGKQVTATSNLKLFSPCLQATNWGSLGSLVYSPKDGYSHPDTKVWFDKTDWAFHLLKGWGSWTAHAQPQDEKYLRLPLHFNPEGLPASLLNLVNFWGVVLVPPLTLLPQDAFWEPLTCLHGLHDTCRMRRG